MKHVEVTWMVPFDEFDQVDSSREIRRVVEGLRLLGRRGDWTSWQADSQYRVQVVLVVEDWMDLRRWVQALAAFGPRVFSRGYTVREVAAA